MKKLLRKILNVEKLKLIAFTNVLVGLDLPQFIGHNAKQQRVQYRGLVVTRKLSYRSTNMKHYL